VKERQHNNSTSQIVEINRINKIQPLMHS